MTSVLVIDDSALMRRVLREFFEEAGMQVVTARGGKEALRSLAAARPDVVTLDVYMPDMDGITCLREIMRSDPVPVVMVSVMTTDGAKATVHALELGAVDYIAKPDAAVSLRLGEIRAELVAKVQRAAEARPRRSQGTAPTPANTTAPAPVPATDPDGSGPDGGAASPAAVMPPPELVLWGASTGGPGILADLVQGLPVSFPPVVLAQHLPAAFTGHLASRLDTAGVVRVVEVRGLSTLEPGTVYIGRGDADVVVVRRNGVLAAKSVPPSGDFRWHPSVDRLVRTALAVVPAERLVGVLLTGMGNDGAEALTELFRLGGRTIAESEDSAVVLGMPGALVGNGAANVVLPAQSISAQLIAWAKTDNSAPRRMAG